MTTEQEKVIASIVEETRNRAIYLLSLDGVPQSQIGALFGMTERGVRNVLAREREANKRISNTSLAKSQCTCKARRELPASSKTRAVNESILRLHDTGKFNTEQIAERTYNSPHKGYYASLAELKREEGDRFAKWCERVETVIAEAYNEEGDN